MCRNLQYPARAQNNGTENGKIAVFHPYCEPIRPPVQCSAQCGQCEAFHFLIIFNDTNEFKTDLPFAPMVPHRLLRFGGKCHRHFYDWFHNHFLQEFDGLQPAAFVFRDNHVSSIWHLAEWTFCLIRVFQVLELWNICLCKISEPQQTLLYAKDNSGNKWIRCHIWLMDNGVIDSKQVQ